MKEINKLAIAIIITEFIIATGFFLAVHYGIYPLKTEVIQVVNAGDVVSYDAPTQGVSDSDGEVSQEDETPLAIEKIVDIVHQLESSGGKNNFSKCEAAGKYNEFGYNIPNCYEKGEDRKLVEKWFEEKLTKYDLPTSICGYNLGFRSEHLQECINQSEKYPYYKDYLTLLPDTI